MGPPRDQSGPTPCSSRDIYCRLPRTVSRQVLNMSKDGNNLSGQLQCLSTPTVKKFFLMFRCLVLQLGKIPLTHLFSKMNCPRSFSLSLRMTDVAIPSPSSWSFSGCTSVSLYIWSYSPLNIHVCRCIAPYIGVFYKNAIKCLCLSLLRPFRTGGEISYLTAFSPTSNTIVSWGSLSTYYCTSPGFIDAGLGIPT